MNNCIYCNSSNIQPDVEVRQSTQVNVIGLEYHTGFLLTGVEPFYAELCKDCGSISRLYVKKTDRKWRVKG